MNEPWSLNYRGLAIVPQTSGDADSGYRARYKIVRTDPDGTLTTVHSADCAGQFTSTDDANEAVSDAAHVAIDQLLDGAQPT